MIDLSRITPAPPAEPAAFRGQWHAIEFQPELDVPQRFIVGAAVSADGRLLGWRMAQQANRLRCFYGTRYGSSLWAWLLEEAEMDLQAARGHPVAGFESRSPQLRIGPGAYTSGADWQSALARTFDRIVTVYSADRLPRYQGITQAELRAATNERLKLALPLSFGQFAQPESGVVVIDGDDRHVFDVTHDDGRLATTVVSACYANLDTAQANVYRATADLFRYRAKRPRQQLGLAVLQPTAQDAMPAETRAAWRAWWAEESYKFKQADDILVADPAAADGIAQALADWYG